MTPAIRSAALTLALSISLPISLLVSLLISPQVHAAGAAEGTPSVEVPAQNSRPRAAPKVREIRAESDEVLPPGMTATREAPSPAETRRPRSARKDSGKDAEGTAAPNRFEAETVIKSQYTLDGKPLEVDPD
jgi:hypothetical protein